MTKQLKEIEIPFGAKDSELQEVTYFIPEGFHAEIEDDKVVIKKDVNTAEWSEEDENAVKVIKDIIRKSEIIDARIYTNSLKEKLYEWLKSLRHQNTWMPSDEQITALETTLYSNMSRNDEKYSVLSEFISELKKLKE